MAERPLHSVAAGAARKLASFTLLASLGAGLVFGCSGSKVQRPHSSGPEILGDAGPEADGGGVDIDPCNLPAAHENPVGCPCNDEGATYECKVWRVVDGYKNCSYGHNTCSDGRWGVCAGADSVSTTDPHDLPTDAGTTN